MLKKKNTKRDERGFWHRAMETLYKYRCWWVDGPTIWLLGSYHFHFYTLGMYPVPEKLPEVCWAILGMYWGLKEGVRWTLKGIQSRRGSVMVGLWLVSLLEFFFLIQRNPEIYTMPPQMIETSLIILAGFLGLQPFKRAFARKFPKAAEVLSPQEE